MTLARSEFKRKPKPRTWTPPERVPVVLPTPLFQATPTPRRHVEPTPKVNVVKRRRGKHLDPALRAEVAEAAGGWCEVRREGCQGLGHHAHHRLPVGRLGPDTLANLLWVCFSCHEWVHAHPRLSRAKGLVLRPGLDPEVVTCRRLRGTQ